MPASLRLPGIQFEVAAPPSVSALPRMDIPVFVGFAASGPVHQPVAVEDAARFNDIFGQDLRLAQSGVRGEPQYAYLAPAVRAFFRNGGRRCWVVRVAGASAAANRFAIPGLFRMQRGGTEPAFARARSEGSWSDDLTAGAALRSHAVVVTAFTGTVVTLALTSAGEVVAGDLLKLTFPGENVLWLFADSVAPGMGREAVAAGAETYWQWTGSPPAGLPAALPVCERITMDLFVRGAAGDAWSLTDLGFAPAHPRYWASLPDDAAIFTSDSLAGLAAEAGRPRFPLAGANAGSFFLPLEIGPLPSIFQPAIPSPATAVERDGLAALSASLFIDRALGATLSTDLLAEADYIRYQSGSPRKLTGMHAALAIEEASMLAIPDAVQRGWARIDAASIASPPASAPVEHPEWWHALDCSRKAALPRTAAPPAGQFVGCDVEIVPAPQLSLEWLAGGIFKLEWTPHAGSVDILEEATDPAFASAAPIYRGSSGSLTIYGRPDGDYYYRVRRTAHGASSDYSNGVAARIERAPGWQTVAAENYDGRMLLDVQRAALRMCAARGDLFAVLAMPEHYRERDALAHSAQLRLAAPGIGNVSAIGPGERGALSYGALYHPWPIGREENDLENLRSNPPDGAAAGILAKRAADRGAWIAPANEALRGVAALTPPISRAYWQALQDAQINLVRQEPRGFLCLSETTLSPDPDLQPINVRRLLSLVRRAALRAGAEYVFEPNGEDFRRAVERGFEKLLDGMFLQGAFAGRTARQGYQVSTGGAWNTPAAAANGRFFVELKVAPSLPLRFLTVRLLQTADRTFVTEGN